MRYKTDTRAGMLLIECLVYIALLAVVLGLAYAAYYRCEDNSKRLGRSVDDVLRALQAGERWRDDVRAATNVILAENALRLVQTNATVDYVFGGDAIWRWAGNGAPPALFLAGLKSSRMEPDARREVAAWRWEVELARGRGAPARFHPFFTFEAVPPGAVKTNIESK
jgi:hypothetical protein